MSRKRILFLFLFALIHGTKAQQSKIERIHEVVTLIDQKVRTLEFRGSLFEDDYGNETTVKAYYAESVLLKLVATSRNLSGTSEKSFYFHEGKLVLVYVFEMDHPGLPNWEEAKSTDLEDKELQRVQNIVTEERRLYLDDLVVIKSLPLSSEDKIVQGQNLVQEARTFLRRL